MRSFDAVRLLGELQSLPRSLRGAVTLLAAERLLPVLRSYSGERGTDEAQVVCEALTKCWSILIGRYTETSDLDLLSQELYELRPETQDNDSALSSYALDAVGAAWDAIEVVRTGDPNRAVEAAQLLYESARMRVDDREEFDPQDPADQAAASVRREITDELATQEEHLAYARRFMDNPSLGVTELRAAFSQVP